MKGENSLECDVKTSWASLEAETPNLAKVIQQFFTFSPPQIPEGNYTLQQITAMERSFWENSLTSFRGSILGLQIAFFHSSLSTFLSPMTKHFSFLCSVPFPFPLPRLKVHSRWYSELDFRLKSLLTLPTLNSLATLKVFTWSKGN